MQLDNTDLQACVIIKGICLLLWGVLQFPRWMLEHQWDFHDSEDDQWTKSTQKKNLNCHTALTSHSKEEKKAGSLSPTNNS